MSLANYDKGKMLNKGAFGQAWLARDRRSGVKYVMKTVDISKLSKKERDASRKEVQILGALKHPNIIEYREAFEDHSQLCIVMAYAEGGDLSGKIKSQMGRPFTEDQILDWFVQICLALKHVHDRKILHRDLKSQNIFLTGKSKLIKLGDFGIAKVLGSTAEVAKTAIGTPYYLSPEICEGKPYNNKSDIWSMGVILYEMCMLKCPFDASNLHGLVLKIIRGVYPPISANFSPSLKSLVSLLLTKAPSARPNINQILTMPVLTSRINNFLDDHVRRSEFSHTVMHGIKTDLPDISHLETAKKGIPVSSARPSAGPPSSRSNPSSSKPSPTARPSPTSKASAGPTGPVYPSYPAANAGYPSFPSASPSTVKPGAGGASPGDAGRAKELEREREKARARDEEKSRQERMQRGAKAVDHGLGGGAHKVVEASSKQEAAAYAEQNYLQMKKQAAMDEKERAALDKREKERQDLARLRDERRRDFLQKQREAEAERRKAAAAAAGSRVPNSKTPEPTGIQIFTKVEVGRKPGVGDAAERRKAFQEQQAEAERNRRRAEQDVGRVAAGGAGAGAGGAHRTPRSDSTGEELGNRAAVLAQREREKELKRLEEEAALEKIRRENFEARKAAAAAAAPPPVIHVDLKSGAEGKESKEVKGDSIEGVMVYTSHAQGAGGGEADDGDDVIKTEQLEGEMVSGEEDVEAAEEDADFGAMLEEMTALIVHEEDIKVVEADKVAAGGGLDRWEGEEGNTESSHERIEELRVFLEKELGFDRFFASYQYVKENRESDEDVEILTAKITDLMGDEGAALFPLLMQLISCEERTYGS